MCVTHEILCATHDILLGFVFLNPNSQVFCPHFHFLGPEDFYNSLFVAKFTLSFQNHHVNRTPDVETCCAEKKYKIFVKLQFCLEEGQRN